MIMVIPLTRAIVGTSVGTVASIVPLVIASFPFVSRLVESSLREINPNIIETAQSMGATPLQLSLIHIFEISVAENTDALMSDYISRYYSETEDMPKYIYCSLPFTDMSLLNDWLGGKIKTARLEQDKAILETAKKNCRERILQHAGKAYKAERDLSSFREFTGISSADNMEVYDISHIAGENVVCGMIACVNGKTEKSRYKRFKIEKRYGNDDTAYMKEAVRRRLSRYFEGDKNFSPLPDVIICDGGLGQIHACLLYTSSCV